MQLVMHACEKLLHYCKAQGQESQSVRQLSWTDMYHVVPAEKGVKLSDIHHCSSAICG